MTGSPRAAIKRPSTSRLPRLLATGALFLVACRGGTPPTAPDAVPLDATAPATAIPLGAPVRWRGVGHTATGTVRYGVQDGVAKLEFSSDFTVGAVPGPFVYVNTTNNANTGRPLRVAALKSGIGSQSYTFRLPTDAAYTWVLIWCDPYNVPVAEASLPSP